MININDLEMFVAFSEMGTLKKVSDKFHISNPSVTRAMQNLEKDLDVTLFERGKNKIELNTTGIYTADLAKNILESIKQFKLSVKNFEKSLRTISVSSCAPAPLWSLLPTIASVYPQFSIESSIDSLEDIENKLRQGLCDIAVLKYKIDDDAVDEKYSIHHYMDENLYVCVPKNHELSNRNEISFKDINGYNFLLRSHIGFWEKICRDHMPSSKFLVQRNNFEFEELISNSSLPSFITDVVMNSSGVPKDRLPIPMTDECVHISFYVYVNNNMNLSL